MPVVIDPGRHTEPAAGECGHLLGHAGDLKEPLAPVAARPRQEARLGRGHAVEQVRVEAEGGGGLVDVPGVGLGAGDQGLQLGRVETAVGGEHLVGQGHPAGLGATADQGAEMAEGPVELTLDDQQAHGRGKDHGQGRGQPGRAAEQPAAQPQPADEQQRRGQHQAEHAQGKGQQARQEAGAGEPLRRQAEQDHDAGHRRDRQAGRLGQGQEHGPAGGDRFFLRPGPRLRLFFALAAGCAFARPAGRPDRRLALLRPGVRPTLRWRGYGRRGRRLGRLLPDRPFLCCQNAVFLLLLSFFLFAPVAGF